MSSVIKENDILFLAWQTPQQKSSLLTEIYTQIGWLYQIFVKYPHSFMFFYDIVFDGCMWFIPIHILQGCFTCTGAIIWLPQCKWSNPEGYWRINHINPLPVKQSLMILGKWIKENPLKPSVSDVTMKEIGKSDLCAKWHWTKTRQTNSFYNSLDAMYFLSVFSTYPSHYVARHKIWISPDELTHFIGL